MGGQLASSSLKTHQRRVSVSPALLCLPACLQLGLEGDEAAREVYVEALERGSREQRQEPTWAASPEEGAKIKVSARVPIIAIFLGTWWP